MFKNLLTENWNEMFTLASRDGAAVWPSLATSSWTLQMLWKKNIIIKLLIVIVANSLKQIKKIFKMIYSNCSNYSKDLILVSFQLDFLSNNQSQILNTFLTAAFYIYQNAREPKLKFNLFCSQQVAACWRLGIKMLEKNNINIKCLKIIMNCR